MTHSIQVVDEKSKIINDMDLLLFLRIAIEIVLEDDSRFTSLDTISNMWSKAIEEQAPGTIDIHMDLIVADQSAENQVLELLTAVEQKLATFGAMLPASLIKQRWAIKRIVFKDYEVARLSKVISDLRELISG